MKFFTGANNFTHSLSVLNYICETQLLLTLFIHYWQNVFEILKERYKSDVEKAVVFIYKNDFINIYEKNTRVIKLTWESSLLGYNRGRMAITIMPDEIVIDNYHSKEGHIHIDPRKTLQARKNKT